MLERFFKLREHGTTVSIEIAAGVATFLTAAYILSVNPSIISNTGMPESALFTATALSIIVGTLLVGLFANMPFILAPGMGINIYFTYSLVGPQKYTWPEALTAVLLAGVLFVLTGAFGLREALIKGFPEPLKHSITVSLGLMIAIIGLKNAGVIVMHEDFVALGAINEIGSPMLAMLGILITGVFVAMNVRGAFLLGIAATTAIGALMGVTDYKPLLESGVVSMPPSLDPIAMAFSLEWGRILTMDFAIAVFTLLAIDIFDSLGTMVGVFANFEGEDLARYEKRLPRALMCDAVATVAGACLGTSTVTTYVESSTGIAYGGRTGLTAVTIAVLVLLSMFISPLFLMVPFAATAPALVIVGMYMMGLSFKIHFNDVTEGLPAIIGILVTALTLSISDGLMFGWIAFMAFKLFAGRRHELNATVVGVGVFFIGRLLLM